MANSQVDRPAIRKTILPGFHPDPSILRVGDDSLERTTLSSLRFVAEIGSDLAQKRRGAPAGETTESGPMEPGR